MKFVKNFFYCSWLSYIRKHNNGYGGSNQSVSFREGTNVHFNSPEFLQNGPQEQHNLVSVAILDQDSLFNLQPHNLVVLWPG